MRPRALEPGYDCIGPLRITCAVLSDDESLHATLPRPPRSVNLCTLSALGMQCWEYRFFLRGSDGLTKPALEAARLSRDAGPERRADEYFVLDGDHGLKRRGGAAAGEQLELKTCVERKPDGAEQLHRTALTRAGDCWRDASGASLEPSLAAAVNKAVAGPSVRVEKQRWTASSDDGVWREVTKLTLANGDEWLTLCCEGDDAAAVAAAGAALQRAVLSAAHLLPNAARVCSYPAWLCALRATEHAAACR